MWHVVEAEGLPGVESLGLLPAAGLHALAKAPGTGSNRDDFLPLMLPGNMMAVLRFQQMADAKLLPSLAGAYAGQPAQWRAMIDSHVFFWADPARRDSFIRAIRRERTRSMAAASDAPPAVLAFETEALVQALPGQAFYSVFNTGSTVRGAARARRDEGTFRPVAAYRSGPAAELAIRAAIPPALLARARLP